MKRILSIIITLILISTIGTSVYAENSFKYKTDSDKHLFQVEGNNVVEQKLNSDFINKINASVVSDNKEIINAIALLPQIIMFGQNQQTQGESTNKVLSAVEQKKQNTENHNSTETSKVDAAYQEYLKITQQRQKELDEEKNKLKKLYLSSGDTNFDKEYSSATYSNDVYLLAQVMNAEAGGQGEDGMLAVGVVVMNRVHSSRFPNTISGVIAAPNQFSSYKSPIWSQKTPTQYHLQLAQYVISNWGKAATKLGLTQAYYFMNRAESDKDNVTWFDSSLRFIKKIGTHEFFGYK